MIDGVVMAHERRRAWAEDLGAQLDIPIVWDRVNDRHDTGLRCLQAGLESSASHWLIVQDDALVCRDLLAGLEVATGYSEDRLLGLYMGNFRTETGDVRRRVLTARRSGCPWVLAPGPWWGVAIVVPTVHLPRLCEWFATSEIQNYDRRIERWAKAAGVECWYTVPSLVQHRHGEENPSLIWGDGRTSTNRKAQWFIGAEASALDVDWSGPPLAIGNHSAYRHVETGRVINVRPGSAQAIRYEATGSWEPVG